MNLLERKNVHGAIIVILGVVVYANTLHVPFYFDDYLNIINLPLIKKLSNFIDPESARVFKYPYGGFVQRYFGYLTFALNYRFSALNPTGYHLVNTAIHLSAALLVYRLVTLTFKTPLCADGRGRAGFVALFSALLFVAHPLQTQAVTYIVQRFTSLSALLYLLSLTCYLRARLIRYETAKRAFAAVAWFMAALVSAILAMRTKEIAFTLPLIAVLYEVLFFPGKIKRNLLVIALSLLALAGSIAVFSSTLSGGSFGEIIRNLDSATRVQTDVSRWDYLATQCRVLVTYLRLAIFPFGQRLDYDYPTFHSFLDPHVLLSAALLCSLLAAALYSLRLSRRNERRAAGDAALLRLASFGIFWFFITLAIESSIIPIVDVIFEHRMYLPSAGLFMAVAAIVSRAGGSGALVPGWPRTPVIAGAALVIFILSGTTVVRNRLWQDPVSFWRDNAQKSPRKGRIFHNLGRALESSGDFAGAEEAYRTAANMPGPAQADALASLGLLHITLGRLTEALSESQAALALESGNGRAHNNIGMIYGSLGRYDEALKEFLLTVHFMPDQTEPYNNIGFIHARQQRYDEALQDYEKALALDPGNDLAYVNRGKALMAVGRRDQAIADFRRALQCNPANADAAAQLQNVTTSRK